MPPSNVSALLFFLCFLFYIDTLVQSGKLRKVDRGFEDRSDDVASGKSQMDSTRDSRIERLMERSEKYVRFGSPSEYPESSDSKRREKTPRLQTRRKFDTSENKNRPVHRKKNEHRGRKFYERSSGVDANRDETPKNLDSQSNTTNTNDCSTSQISGSKGCLPSKERQKRQIKFLSKVNTNGIAIGNGNTIGNGNATCNLCNQPCICDLLELLNQIVLQWPSSWSFQWPFWYAG